MWRPLLLIGLLTLGVPLQAAGAAAPERATPAGGARPIVPEAAGSLSPALIGVEVEGGGYPAAHTAWLEATTQLARAEELEVSGEGRVHELGAVVAEVAGRLEAARATADRLAGRERDKRRRLVGVAVGSYVANDGLPPIGRALAVAAGRDDHARAAVLGSALADDAAGQLERAAARAGRAAAEVSDIERRFEHASADHRAAETAFADAGQRVETWTAAVAHRVAALPNAARASRVAEIGLRTVVLDAYVSGSRHPGASCGIPWNLLAGIGRVESRHGEYRGSRPDDRGQVLPRIIGIALDGTRNTMVIRDSDGGVHDGDTVYDRAVGPMQFIPSTWARHGVDGDGNGFADPSNLYDAAASAASYLCKVMPSDGDLGRAVLSYNRSQAYVNDVLGHARTYGALDLPSPSASPGA